MKSVIQRIALGTLAVLWVGAAHAQTGVPAMSGVIHKAVENFLRTQTAGLPGTVSYSVGAIDPRVVLPACGALEVFLPSGARLWGQTSVGVRCNGATPWNIYVTAEVRVVGNYLVTARPLSQGHVLAAADLALQAGDLTQLPAGILSDPQQAAGKTLLAALAPSQPIRQDMLRSPLVVQQGQSVKLQSTGRGFRVTAEGRALNNAQDGQVAQVRGTSGQTISGIARAGGVVEISF